MEYIYIFLFLLYVISTSSLIIPSSDISSWSRRLTLRSSDPLTRRSAAERNFIRFGRSVTSQNARFLRNTEHTSLEATSNHKLNLNKREALHFSNDNADHEFTTGAADPDINLDQLKGRSDKDSNLLCLVPEEDSNDHMLCIGPQQNVSSQFYVVTDQEEDSPNSNQADSFLRSARSSEDVDRIRKSKSNFMRLGRSKFSMFNRYDRGRDNFMRLGRSLNDGGVAAEKRRHDNFMRLGRFANGEYNRSSRFYTRITRGRDNFMRLGRMSEDEFDRYSRRHDNFMRLGRAQPIYNRYLRRHDNFMRLGRASDDNLDRFARRHDNFMRLGRSSDDELDRSLEHHRKFMKMGRTSEDGFSRSERRHDNFMRLDRSPDDNLEGTARQHNFTSSDFTRLGRSSENTLDQIVNLDSGGQFVLGQKSYGAAGRSVNQQAGETLDSEERRRDDVAQAILLSPREQTSQTRIGRTSEDPFGRYARRTDNFMRLGRALEMNEPIEWVNEENRDSKPEGITKTVWRTRFGRSADSGHGNNDITSESKQPFPRRDSNIESGNGPLELTKTECLDLPKGFETGELNSNSQDGNNVSSSNITKCMYYFGNKKPEHVDNKRSPEKVENEENGDIHDEFSRQTRRRGLYLRFGRSGSSRATNFNEK